MTGFSGELPPDAFNLSQYCLRDSAARLPDKTALQICRSVESSETDQIWTYAELEGAVLSVAQGLRARDLSQGSRLFIRMGNNVEFALTFFGAIAAGLVPIPGSAMLTAAEVAFMVKDAGASAIAHTSELALPALPPGITVLSGEQIIDMTALPACDYVPTRANDPAYLIYTSGSSGRPKGVLHAHRAAWGRRPMYDGWYGLSENDVMLHTGAFNWAYTLGTAMFDPWANGATTVLYTGPKDIHVWPTLIADAGATLFASVPTLFRQLLKHGNLQQNDLGGLRHGLAAGEPLPVSVADDWRRVTGRELYEALGMSEISTYISNTPSMANKRGSTGRPQAGRAVAILEADKDTPEHCPSGKPGLIAVHRSDPGLMLGYWNRPEEEAEAYRGDWFCGGDIGTMDADGYIWFGGRNNDLMNAFGYRVSPIEVEDVLISHGDVGEAAVAEISVNDTVSIIVAFIVVADGVCNFDSEQLLAHATDRLAPYKMPRAIHVVDSLPRSANGKLNRSALKTLYRDGGENRTPVSLG
jgi:acyl-coenzyme A synthetase/AMP-(fatty) acid ligase